MKCLCKDHMEAIKCATEDAIMFRMQTMLKEHSTETECLRRLELYKPLSDEFIETVPEGEKP